jgi:hypothetical protein
MFDLFLIPHDLPINFAPLLFPNQVFTILVWGDDRQNVGQLPRIGSHICATGLIKDYRGVPEIVVRSSGQFSR